MKRSVLFNFLVDKETNEINVERSFNAPVDMVWSAWTEAEILEQWWAPKPYKAKTKTMDFREGGYWLYAMVGPENEEQYVKVDYITINPLKSFSAFDGFCDANGNINLSLPRNRWHNTFTGQNQQTLVNIRLTFDSLEDLENIIEMGFKEGFTAALENLDQYIEEQSLLRKQK